MPPLSLSNPGFTSTNPYDLRTDIGETQSRASTLPDKVKNS
jgi:hypothetical protein